MKTENYGEKPKVNGKHLTFHNRPKEVLYEDYEEDESSSNEAHHLMELGRSGRHLITRDTPSSSPVVANNGNPNHLAVEMPVERRLSSSKSVRSVSSARGGGGSIRQGSSTPEDASGRQ